MQLASPSIASTANENVASTARYITQTNLDQERKEYTSLWLKEQDQLRVVAECEDRIKLLESQMRSLQERKERVRIEAKFTESCRNEKTISIKKLEEALREANTKEEMEHVERLKEYKAFQYRQSQKNINTMQGETKSFTSTTGELADELLVVKSNTNKNTSTRVVLGVTGVISTNKICKFWQNGNCKSGTNCKFSHDEDDDSDYLPEKDEDGGTESDGDDQEEEGEETVALCNFFLRNGKCKNGNSCKYSHSEKRNYE